MSDISIQEAENRLLAESQKVFDKDLHPCGKQITLHIIDPSIGSAICRTWNFDCTPNGTWEYVNPQLDTP